MSTTSISKKLIYKCLLLYSIIQLSSCQGGFYDYWFGVGEKKPKAEEKYNSWLGHTKHELIMSWGPPLRTGDDGNQGEILIYGKHVYDQYYGWNFWNLVMFYADKSGKIYHWITKTENTPPTQIDLNIYKR